jgi:hypothetical protein
MDLLILRLPDPGKLADGRLRHDYIPRMWDGPGNRETRGGCGVEFHVRPGMRRAARPRLPAPRFLQAKTLPGFSETCEAAPVRVTVGAASALR